MNKLCAGLAALAALVSAGARAGAVSLTQEADVSLRQYYLRTPRGAPSAKYQEYRSIPNGLNLERYDLGLDWGGYGLAFSARNVNQSDQSYRLEGGRYGAFSYKASWDQAPHVYSNDGRTLYQASQNGRLSLSDQLQTTLQATAAAAYRQTLESFLAGAASVPLAVQNETAAMDLSWRPAQGWLATLAASRMRRYGSRPKGATFGLSNAVEVAEPVDHAAYDMSLGLHYARPRWQLGFRYDFSAFRNGVDVLVWDNPKRITDRYTVANGYSAGDQSASGRMPLAPDNDAHSWTFSGGAELPYRTRASAEFTYGRWRHKSDMLPYTVNSAMNPTNVVAGVTPPFDASTRAGLPGEFVDNRMDVLAQNYRLTNSWVSGLRATASWKSYSLENTSSEYHFPGFAVVDQTWQNNGVTNHRLEYRKDNTDVKLDYDAATWLSASAGWGHEYWRRSREVNRSREHQASAGVVLRPARDFFVNLSWLGGWRRMSALDHEHYKDAGGAFFEMPGLIRFDVGDRNRNQGRVQAQWARGDSSYALSARVTQDKYRPGNASLDGGLSGVNQFKQYGLLEQTDQAVGADLSQALGADWTVDLFYEYDFSRRIIQSNTNGAAVNQNVTNDWQMRTAETSNIGGVELSWQPAADWKTSLGYDVVHTIGRSDPVHNGATSNVDSLMPTSRVTQTLGWKGRWQALKNLAVTGRWEFQKFDVADYSNGLVPLNTADAMYLGNSLRNYTAHALALGLSYTY